MFFYIFSSDPAKKQKHIFKFPKVNLLLYRCSDPSEILIAQNISV